MIQGLMHVLNEVKRRTSERGASLSDLDALAALVGLKHWIQENIDREIEDLANYHSKYEPGKKEPDEIDKRSWGSPWVGTHCGADGCGLPQYQTPGGVSCDRGHGGAPSIP